MRLFFHKTFAKNYSKLPVSLQLACDERIELFVKDPHAPVLRNHKLHGSLSAHRSINITGDVRAIFMQEGDDVTFVRLGTHTELYR